MLKKKMNFINQNEMNSPQMNDSSLNTRDACAWSHNGGMTIKHQRTTRLVINYKCHLKPKKKKVRLNVVIIFLYLKKFHSKGPLSLSLSLNIRSTAAF